MTTTIREAHNDHAERRQLGVRTAAGRSGAQPGRPPVATLGGELAVSGQSLLAVSGQIVLAANSQNR